jgi:hypothetical protein
LESIEFAIKGPLGDGALRNSVAYIRYWNRPGSKSTAENSAQIIDATQIDPALDPQLQTAEQLANAWYDGGELPDNTTIEYSTSLPGEADATDWYTVNTGVERDEDGNIIRGISQTVFASPNTDRQKALSQEIPTTRTYSGDPRAIIVADTEQIGGGGRGSRVADQQIGQVKPANPNGFVNTVSRTGRSVLGLPPGQIGYTGQAGGAQGGKAALASGGTLTKGMWQFLFNPSELEIEAGPEFRTAETWGVSDKANSGQPLNWSHNKNTQLKFNSVLLNGYVFGRKVEELEQGIFELFMARDGEGQAGPPILEFVWGKRVFGPCVIKDISIKEKMWDEGMVVNAELSFTLEQIPEWTINDGYVDVARPGRIPMVNDATESGPVGVGSTVPSGTPSDPGSPDSPSQKPPAPAGSKSGDGKLCDWALNISKQFQQLYVRVNNPLTAAAFGNFNSQVSQFYSLKGSLYSGSSEIGSYVDTKVASGCKRSSYQATTENIKKTGGGFSLNGGLISAEQQTIQFIRECTASTKRAIDEWQRTSPKCKPQRVVGQAARVSEAQNTACAKYSGKCSTPNERFGTTGQCPQVNNGRGVICSGGVWTPL